VIATHDGGSRHVEQVLGMDAGMLNERLRRMAQEIIITQQQEIAAMRLAVDQPIPPSVPSLEQLSSAQLGSKSVPYRPTDPAKEP
jgi:hypothetical protein